MFCRNPQVRHATREPALLPDVFRCRPASGHQFGASLRPVPLQRSLNSSCISPEASPLLRRNVYGYASVTTRHEAPHDCQGSCRSCSNFVSKPGISRAWSLMIWAGLQALVYTLESRGRSCNRCCSGNRGASLSDGSRWPHKTRPRSVLSTFPASLALPADERLPPRYAKWFGRRVFHQAGPEQTCF